MLRPPLLRRGRLPLGFHRLVLRRRGLLDRSRRPRAPAHVDAVPVDGLSVPAEPADRPLLSAHVGLPAPADPLHPARGRRPAVPARVRGSARDVRARPRAPALAARGAARGLLLPALRRVLLERPARGHRAFVRPDPVAALGRRAAPRLRSARPAPADPARPALRIPDGHRRLPGEPPRRPLSRRGLRRVRSRAERLRARGLDLGGRPRPGDGARARDGDDPPRAGLDVSRRNAALPQRGSDLPGVARRRPPSGPRAREPRDAASTAA